MHGLVFPLQCWFEFNCIWNCKIGRNKDSCYAQHLEHRRIGPQDSKWESELLKIGKKADFRHFGLCRKDFCWICFLSLWGKLSLSFEILKFLIAVLLAVKKSIHSNKVSAPPEVWWENIPRCVINARRSVQHTIPHLQCHTKSLYHAIPYYTTQYCAILYNTT